MGGNNSRQSSPHNQRKKHHGHNQERVRENVANSTEHNHGTNIHIGPDTDQRKVANNRTEGGGVTVHTDIPSTKQHDPHQHHRQHDKSPRQHDKSPRQHHRQPKSSPQQKHQHLHPQKPVRTDSDTDDEHISTAPRLIRR